MTQSITNLFDIPEAFDGNINDGGIKKTFINYIKEKISIFTYLKPGIIKSKPDSYSEFNKRVNDWIEKVTLRGDELGIVKEDYNHMLTKLTEYLSRTNVEDHINFLSKLNERKK